MLDSAGRLTLSGLIVMLGSLSVPALDLKDAVVFAPSGLSGTEKKAVAMLVEEAEKRTHIRWPQSAVWPSSNATVIALATRPQLQSLAGILPPELSGVAETVAAEGYRLCLRETKTGSTIFVIGNDSRGLLFGAGRLLRELKMQPGGVALDDRVDIRTAPKYALRGHQLGYRPKCNSYDAWDLPTWEQYFRDLAVFGCNAIELIPPRSDDDADSPHFPLPPMEMMIGMSRLADSYGLDVWIWYPAMDKDYADPKTVEFAIKEWGEAFRKLPRIDAVFVPGGDPGHTQPKFLMALLEKQTESLHRYHPRAQMWVSPQSFNQAWLDEFLDILNRQRPQWLSGIVFGPQVRMTLPRLRQRIPEQYPIRHYPDITHSRQCQFPVADWDVAYAITEARECINPRPEAEATIFRKLQPYTVGFLTYSEGCNDDVNKTVWSCLGWDPDGDVNDILREYSRYFIGEQFGADFARGLLALEQNWRGALATNETVEKTLTQFQTMENAAPPALLKNWRFQQALFRAYYDAYTRRRLIAGTRSENEALQLLRAASSRGSLDAISDAERSLSSVPSDPLRTRILTLGEALFQSIGMQLSVEKYKAIAVDRGASLDTLDFPLNNRPWLVEQFARIRKFGSESERLKEIGGIVQWMNAGPGGFYDDLGHPARQPHLVKGAGFTDDPGSMESPRAGFEEDLVVDEPDEPSSNARRVSWMDHAETLYDTPLQMHYPGLDSKARYKIRVVYGGDAPKRKIRLVAGNEIEIHPLLLKPFPIKPLEFSIPQAATAGGELTLTWTGEPGLGGNGRGCQVSEIWLMKENDAEHRK
jgi:hypothetical protein